MGLATATLATASDMHLMQMYEDAVNLARDGQLPSLPLVSVPADVSTVRVVTWTPEKVDIGTAIDTAASRRVGDVWVSLMSEIQSRCQGFSQEERKNLPVRIKQLLGLPPDFMGGQAGGFAVIEVNASDGRDLFRPCMNPDSTQTSCVAPPPRVPSNSAEEHIKWMAKVTHDSYEKLPPADRFPWTQLGYTYDWSTPAMPYGVSEYIVRNGSTVKQLGWQPLNEFCAAKP